MVQHWDAVAVASREPAEIRELTEHLLEYVRDESPMFGRLVPLKPFWRRRDDLTIGDRYQALKPLLEKKVLLVPARGSKDRVQPYDVGTAAFNGLPDRVVLSQRDWQRMIWDNVSPQTIINDWRHSTVNQNRQIGNNSRFANAQTRTGDATADVSTISDGFTAQNLEALSSALRTDAAPLEPIAAAMVNQLADQVDAIKHDPSGPEATDVLENVENMAKAAGALNATLEVLRRIKDLV